MIKLLFFPRLVLVLVFKLLLLTQLSAQKISILFATTPSSTPSVSKAALRFDKDFAFSLTFDDATVDVFTTAMPVLRGGFVRGSGATYPGLFYTDGCGNSLPFNAGIAWNTANLFGIDVHVGNVANQMTWGQLDTLYDLGWDVLNHSYAHRSSPLLRMTPDDYTNEIMQNNIAVRNKTRRRIEMPIFVVPANDYAYHPYVFAAGHKILLDQSQPTIPSYGGFRIDTVQNLFGLKLHRTYINELYQRSVPQFVDTVALRSRNGVKMWFNEYAHRVDDFNTNTFEYNFYYFKSHLESIANQYGKTGQDRMWMAPPQEVYEYLVVKQTATFTSQFAGKQLDVTFDLRQVPTWLRRKTMTLVLNSTIDMSNVVVPAGVKMTYCSGNKKIINLDFTDFKVATNDLPSTPSVLAVFPNPVKDIVSVDCKTLKTGDIQARIFDISGKLMYQNDFDNPAFQVSTKGLADGLYYIMVQQGNQIFRGKFVKQ